MAVALAIGMVTSVVASLAEALPFDLGSTDWEGCAEFLRLARSEAGSGRVVATARIDWAAVHPGDAIFLLHPEKPVDYRSAGAFVRAGGELVVLDDFGAADDLLLSFDVRRVHLPGRPLSALRSNPELAIAEPTAPDYPLTQHVDRVVTNHATGLEQPQMRTVLEVRGAGGVSVPLALATNFTAGAAGSASGVPGRLVAVGDPSIVMNSMLRYPGNREFARNLIRDVMARGPGGHIYVASGTFAEAGAFAGASDPAFEWLASLRHTGATLDSEGLPGWMIYWFVLVVALTIVAWLIPTAARTYRASTPRFTRRIPLHAQGGTAGHAAVISAKGTSRGHAMIEWKHAFEEEVTWRLGLARTPAADDLVRRIRAAGWIDADGARSLTRLLLRMAEIETMFLAQRADALRAISDHEVVLAGAKVQKILSLARTPGKRGHAA